MGLVEYSNESVARIRSLARAGWPHGAVAAMMGWDVARLERVAKKHDIPFYVFKARSKTPDPVKAGIRWDADKNRAFHGEQSIYLPPAEGRLFAAMLRLADYDWDVDKLSAVAKIPRGSVSAQLSFLRVNLECIGLTITRRSYQISRL